ncbi:integrase [Thermococcus peptonophilus]|nr:integrase [Thermococcus peptonophilus]
MVGEGVKGVGDGGGPHRIESAPVSSVIRKSVSLVSSVNNSLINVNKVNTDYTVNMVDKVVNGVDGGGGFYFINSVDMVVDYWSVREEFKRWLERRVSRAVARDYISALDRFVGKRIIRSPVEVVEILEATNHNNRFVNGFRNLLSFLEMRERINAELLVKLRRVLKVKKSGVDLYVPTDKEVRFWFSKVKGREDVCLAFLLTAFGGVRIAEAVKVLREFDRRMLKIEGVNGKEIAYYELNWVRGFKRSNVVFMPVWLARGLRRLDTSYDRVRSYAGKRGAPMKYLRKWFINKMMEFGVPEVVIKYMVGHSLQGDIMGLHYLNLLNQAKREYARVVNKLESTLFPGGRPEI